MFLRRQAEQIAVLAAVLVTCGVFVSCATPDTQGRTEYIGPAEGGGEAAKAPVAGEAIAGEQSSPEGTSGPLDITVWQAITMALRNNRALVVEKISPRIRRAVEEQQLAVFDPMLTAQLAFHRAKSRPRGVARSQEYTAQAGIEKLLTTGGVIGLTGSTAYSQFESDDDTKYGSSAVLSANQPLLRGAGRDVNLVTVRQARIDTLSSEYELRGFAENLVALVEEEYWNHVLARKQMDILSQSLALAEQQLSDIRERIRVGVLAETEAVAAEAEVALRRQAMIVGRNNLEKTQLRLLQILSPRGDGPFERAIAVKDEPSLANLDVEPLAGHIEAAMRMRPDLNQARLLVNRGDLDVVKTKNGLLPQLDLFVTLGRTGYADSFGGSVSGDDLRINTLTAGVSGEYPLGNRAARAAHQRAALSRQQSVEALKNLAQLAEVDVRNAYITVTVAKEQVAATAASRKLQEEKVRTETEKFRVGKSTSFLVAQAQRDLVASQIAETQSVASYLNAFVELYRLDGTLLVRKGIKCPGAEAVTMAGDSSSKQAAGGK